MAMMKYIAEVTLPRGPAKLTKECSSREEAEAEMAEKLKSATWAKGFPCRIRVVVHKTK